MFAILALTILLHLAGWIALLSGRLALTRNRRWSGGAVRLAGLLFLVPLVWTLFFALRHARFDVELLFSLLVTNAGCFVLGLLLVLGAGRAESCRPRVPYPAGVLVVIGLVLVSLAANLVGNNPAGVGGAVVAGLILWGACAGHRLTWQWGRLLVPIGAVLSLLLLVAAVAFMDVPRTARLLAILLFGGYAAVMGAIFFAFGTRAAREYFGLICPRCGSTRSRPADFFFNEVRCKQCRWRWGTGFDEPLPVHAGEYFFDVLPADGETIPNPASVPIAAVVPEGRVVWLISRNAGSKGADWRLEWGPETVRLFDHDGVEVLAFGAEEAPLRFFFPSFWESRRDLSIDSGRGHFFFVPDANAIREIRWQSDQVLGTKPARPPGAWRSPSNTGRRSGASPPRARSWPAPAMPTRAGPDP